MVLSLSVIFLIIQISNGTDVVGNEPIEMPNNHTDTSSLGTQQQTKNIPNTAAKSAVEIEKVLGVQENKISQPKANSDSANSTKIPYEGDWCIRGLDLTEDDLRLAKEESIEWAKTKGNIYFSAKDLNGNTSGSLNSELLEPYREMNKEKLLALAFDNDRYAMISAIQRDDISWEAQDRIAGTLLTMGDTSIGLLHLFVNEIVAAEFEYKEQNNVTQEVKQKVINALTYVSYGIRRYDTTALHNYLSMLEDDEILGEILHPSYILSKKDFEKIEANVSDLQRQIDELRIENNLPTISELEIPKIARHEFQSYLSLLYSEYGKHLNSLQSLNSESGPRIDRSECVNRHLKLYGQN